MRYGIRVCLGMGLEYGYMYAWSVFSVCHTYGLELVCLPGILRGHVGYGYDRHGVELFVRGGEVRNVFAQ